MRKTWTRFGFGRHPWRSDQESDGGSGSSDGLAPYDSLGTEQSRLDSDGNHPSADVMHMPMTCDSTQTRSPCHSQLLPQPSDTTNNMNRPHRNIDGDTPHVLGPSTSSNEAVFAMACSSSTEKLDSTTFAVSPTGRSTYPSFNPLRSPPRTGAESNALETSADKLDEDAYSAWWFLSSKSESFDMKPGNQADTTTHENWGGYVHATETRTPVNGGIELKEQFVQQPVMTAAGTPTFKKSMMYELPSRKNSNASSLRNKSQPELPPQQSPPIADIGVNTLREKQLIDKWFKDVEQGGTTFNYDHEDKSIESTATPYSRWDNTSKSELSQDDIEWTPQDSSYGAAVQACGWVPKRTRKMFEGIMFVVMAALLIFFLVKTGMHLKSSGSGEEDKYFSDDDHYAAYNGDGDEHSNRSNDQRDGNHHNI
jgi:hypothetical protein